MPTRLTSAICTPLHPDGTLHGEGLRAHIEAQLTAGIDGILVAGTMGLMQLQTDATYARLIEESFASVARRCELWVGVGDASFARTLTRIRVAERHAVDGLVVLTPYFLNFTEAELIRYFLELAEASTKPLFLYDLPTLTGTALSMELIERVIEHPNIHGLKCTRTWEWTTELYGRFGNRTRVIPAQPERVADLVRLQVSDNLDGLFAIFPNQSRALADAADRGDWAEADRIQADISAFLVTAREKSLFGAVTVVMNALEIPGEMAPAPISQLSDADAQELLAQPLIQRLIENEIKLSVTAEA
ncbi:MAG: dihydrodipicolinate synthase family protein [Pirellulaceae bacterium]